MNSRDTSFSPPDRPQNNPANVQAAEDKAGWRKLLRERLQAMGAAERKDESDRIRRHLLDSSLFDPVRRGGGRGLHCLIFAGSATEPDLLPLLASDELSALSVLWVFPRVLPDGNLSLHQVGAASKDLRPGAFGLLEPVAERCAEVLPEEIDLALMPGLGFGGVSGSSEVGPDLTGPRMVSRLGQGGGYFDRLLPRLRSACPLVGVGFDSQWFVEVPWPSEEHDRMLDAVVTQSGWTRPPSKQAKYRAE